MMYNKCRNKKGGNKVKDRIKEIREKSPNGKNQKLFAEYLGISPANLASYETGRRTPTDAVIQLICQKCDVNEDWLRNGIGEPYIKKTKDEQIAELLGEIQKSGENNFKHRLVSALSKLNESDWESLEKLIDLMAK